MPAAIEASLRLEIAQYQAALAKAKGDAARFKESMKKTGSGLGNDLFGPLKGTLGALGIGYVGKQMLDAVVSMDRLERGMLTLEGSSAAAASRLESLREAARLPGLDFEQAVQGDIRLRSVGLSAELSRRALIEMGNAIANAGGTAEQLDNVTLALTQIVSRGKVTADNINQIANSVPQLRAVMKDVFGTADSEALQKMNISAERFVELTVNGFGKLKRATAGLDEDLTDIGSSIRQMAADAAGPLVKELVPVFRQLVTEVSANKEAIKTFGSTAASAFTELINLAAALNDVRRAAFEDAKVVIESGTDADGNYYEITRQATFIEALKDLNDQRRSALEERQKIDAEFADKPKAGAAGNDPFESSDIAPAGFGVETGDDAKDPFKAAEALAKKQQQVAEKKKQLDEDVMTREQRIAALQKEIVSAQQVEKDIKADPFGGAEGAAIDAEMKRLELQRELNSLLREESAERERLAQQGQDMLDREYEEEQKQNAAKQSLADQIALLQAKAAGNDDLVEKMERELKIRERALEIQAQTGLAADQARRAAEQMIALEDRAERKSQDKSKEDRKPGHIGGVINRRYMQSGLDQFHRDQQRDGTAATAFNTNSLSTRGGFHRAGPLSGPDIALTSRARRNADAADARGNRDTGALDLGGKIFELLQRNLE